MDIHILQNAYSQAVMRDDAKKQAECIKQLESDGLLEAVKYSLEKYEIRKTLTA